MPALETTDRRQTAVWWPGAGTDGYGEAVIGAPVELKVRWLNDFRRLLDARGNTITSEVTVILNQNVSVGDLFWLGKLSALELLTGNVTGIYQVKFADATPDLKNRYTRFTAGCMRYRDVPAAALFSLKELDFVTGGALEFVGGGNIETVNG